jgi:hypothetical protein
VVDLSDPCGEGVVFPTTEFFVIVVKKHVERGEKHAVLRVGGELTERIQKGIRNTVR